MRKIIIAPDSFKGTLTATEAAEIIKKSGEKAFPEARFFTLPIADGGEGSLDAFKTFKNGESVSVSVSGPFGEKVAAEYLIIGGKTAVIETAKAIGITLAGEKRNPLYTTTYGVGELILLALDAGAKEIILTLGGSSTNDGGIGMAVALGAKCYDKSGAEFLPRGGSLRDITRIDLSRMDKRIKDVAFTAMCDVDSPVAGEKGATFIFAPQKGAGEKDLPVLEEGLKNLTALINEFTGEDYFMLKGGGAAGGLGMGAKAFLGAELKSGINTVLSLAEFDKLLDGADLVITGEGRLDSQSLMGKVISGIASYTKKRNIPLYVVCGLNELDENSLSVGGIAGVYPSNPDKLPFEKIKATVREDLAAAACKLFFDLKNK